MSKKIIFVVAAVIVAWLGPVLIGQVQRAGGSAVKGQQVILELPGERFYRGWLKRDAGGKQIVLDARGDSHELTDQAKLHKIFEMEKEFEKKQRDVKSREGGRTAEYSKLLEWGKDRQLYEAVEKLATKIVKRNPANPDREAENAIAWAKEQMAKLKASSAVASGEGEAAEDIQAMRFAFLTRDAYDPNTPITFKENVIRKFLDQMIQEGKIQKEDQKAFIRLSPLQQALIIKQITGQKYQPYIVINKDPVIISGFRRSIQPMLARSCATANCHGGDVSKLKLLARVTSVAQAYQNYYTLDTFRSARGNILDHAQPDKQSLLINYLVAPEFAPASLVHNPQINPLIRNKNDQRYIALVEWLKALPLRPIDYALSEEVPTTTTQPVIPTTQNSVEKQESNLSPTPQAQ